MNTASTRKLGWHITKRRRLGYDDGREVYEGERLTMPKYWYGVNPKICDRGMHAEPSLHQCISDWYKRGNFICRVLVSGDLTNYTNYYGLYSINPNWNTPESNEWKFCGRHRKVIAMVHKSEFYTACMELFGKRWDYLNEKQWHIAFKRAIQLRDMMGLTYHKRPKKRK